MSHRVIQFTYGIRLLGHKYPKQVHILLVVQTASCRSTLEGRSRQVLLYERQQILKIKYTKITRELH